MKNYQKLLIPCGVIFTLSLSAFTTLDAFNAGYESELNQTTINSVEAVGADTASSGVSWQTDRKEFSIRDKRDKGTVQESVNSSLMSTETIDMGSIIEQYQ